MADLNTLLLPLMEGFSGWKNVQGMAEVLPDQMPQPYRDLLVHQRDMTGTLTQFFGHKLGLQVLEKTLRFPILARRVLLVIESTQQPVEYGAIRIHLDHFPEQAKERILVGKDPLGGILNEMNIAYVSRPARFIQIEETDLLKKVFPEGNSGVLYGRCNTLTTPEGHRLAEIVEVLPPLSHP